MKSILHANTCREGVIICAIFAQCRYNGRRKKIFTFFEKGFDFYGGLLYNLATPRYNKVFFPKLYSAGNGYSKG